VVAVTAALLASAQPLLGSFALFIGGEQPNYDAIHLTVGALIYNAALLMAILVPFTTFPRRWLLFVLCAVQYGLLHMQLRLGLGSNEDAGLLAFHIPLGVLILLVSYVAVGWTLGLRLGRRTA
jgi:hypothetical protein